MIEDIAILTGGKVVSEEVGLKLENVELADLGHARKVVANKENTTIVQGRGEAVAIKARVDQIQALMEQSDSEFDKEKLQERKAKLAGGVAVNQCWRGFRDRDERNQTSGGGRGGGH